MKLFVCSDVHGNLRALEAVLERYRAHEPCELLCLGDVVGYGAHPGECLERLMAFPRATLVQGNHDAALIDNRELAGMSELAVVSLRWQRRKLADRFDNAIRERFAMTAEADSYIAAHASPVHPGEWSYVYTPYGAEELFLARDFRVCFIGHTHLPAIFSFARGELELSPGEAVPLDPKDRFIINPGSVGQPRDGDSRAACLICDLGAGIVTLERCVYDVASEVADMREAGLPAYLVDRLPLGL